VIEPIVIEEPETAPLQEDNPLRGESPHNHDASPTYPDEVHLAEECDSPLMGGENLGDELAELNGEDSDH
jgi:hypothetical protein